MPTYSFLCPRCKHEFTNIFAMKDSDGKNVVCPKCKNKGVTRVYKGGVIVGGKSNPSSSSCAACKG